MVCYVWVCACVCVRVSMRLVLFIACVGAEFRRNRFAAIWNEFFFFIQVTKFCNVIKFLLEHVIRMNIIWEWWHFSIPLAQIELKLNTNMRHTHTPIHIIRTFSTYNQSQFLIVFLFFYFLTISSSIFRRINFLLYCFASR